MFRTTIYKYSSDVYKLEQELMTTLKKLPKGKRSQYVSKAQFDIFLKNIPDFAKEQCKKAGIPLCGDPEYTIRCAYYAKQPSL